MPYSKQVLQIPAGINREGTQYSAEGNWFDCDLIRFRQGRPEKIGGWTKYSTNEFLGISRTLVNWSSIDGSNLLAVGSDKKLYVELGGTYYDITPNRYESQGLTSLDMDNVPVDTDAIFSFDVLVGDVVRMPSDANSVGDELMLVKTVPALGEAGETIVMERGSLNTLTSTHGSGSSAFLIKNNLNPVYPVSGSTQVLIKYENHGLVTGDFVNFLRLETDTLPELDRRSLFYTTFDGTSDPGSGYDESRSTQSWQVSNVLTSEYFEIRIANAAGVGNSTTLSIGINRTDSSISLPVSTFANQDIIKIDNEYILLTSAASGTGPYAYTCNRSQFGSIASDHASVSIVREVGRSGNGIGGNTVLMRDQQASASSFTEFNGWGSSGWGGLPGVTVSTALSSDIANSTQTTATVVSTGSFGAAGTLLIGSELVTYVKGSPIGTVFNIVRGQFGTTADMHSTGTSVFEVDQFWTGWGEPHVPQVFSGTALNLWSMDTFGEDLIASRDKSAPYIWNTSLKMRLGSPNQTSFLPNSHSDISGGFASGICLADAVPMSSIPDSGPGAGLVPDQVGFVMTHPTSSRVIAFGSTDSFGEYDPTLVRWCNEDRPGAWDPEPEGSLAGGSPLQRGSRIMAAAISNRQILIWTDLALYSMQWVGGNSVFAFQEVADSISISSRFAHKSGRGITYWMGDNNFYQTDGSTVQKVSCPVLSKVFEELNYDKREVIVSALNSLFSEIIWFYPSRTSEEPDRYVLFNYFDNVWAYGSIGRTGWSDSGLREKPNAAYYLGLYETGPYQGVERSLIYNHEDGYTDDQTKMDSYIESAFFDIEDGDKSMFIDRFVPDFRGLYSTVPELTVDLSARNYPSSPSTTESPKVNTLTLTTATEFVSTRMRGRTMSVKFYDSPSPNINGGWELGASRLRLKSDGER